MTIKQLIVRLILPLTIISFAAFTKWWYVLPEDAPDTMMAGFPFAFVADGWFTSMSIQFFIAEFIADFILYFLFWFLIVLIIKREYIHFNVSKVITKILWTLTVVTILFGILFFTISEKHILVKRDWNRKVIASGYKFTWIYKKRPELSSLKNKEAQLKEIQNWKYAGGYHLGDFLNFQSPLITIINDTIYDNIKPVAIFVKVENRIYTGDKILFIKDIKTNRTGEYIAK